MLNRVEIIGFMGSDPETRFLPNGTAVSSIRVATSEKWTDKDSGEVKEATEWHLVEVFGKLAEICEKYLKKGMRVYFDGKMHTQKWSDKDGKDHYTTKVRAKNMLMLDRKQD